MLFKDISILDKDLALKEHQYVGTRGEFISYIGDEMPEADYGEEYDGKGKLLMSGLYNCHTHSPMTLLRGFGENLRLFDWLDLVQPVESTLTDEEIYTGTTLAIAEMIRYGTVSCSDMYLKIEPEAQAFKDAGFKCNLSWGISLNDGYDSVDDYPSVKVTKKIIEKYKDDPLIIPDIALHGEYTSDEEVVDYVAAFAKENDLRMQVHISESLGEHEECKERHNGMTPAEYLNEHHLFDTPATAAHCVWVEPEDIQIFKKKGVTVASCPFSNMKLASGFCNIPELLKAGVNVNIATDGAASNNSLNQFAELKAAAALAKAVTKDPTVVTPKEAISMVTINGARAQGREDCGALKEGNRADLIVIDIDEPYFMPLYDILTALVYASSGQDVCLTMVDGRVLYKDGEYLTIDIEKAKAEAAKMVTRQK